MLARVGTDLAYGIHGLRVTGYNLCKQARGAEVAAAHGLWQPQSHSRYARFDLVRDIFTFGIIPSAPREFPSAGEAELQCAHLAAHPAGTVHALFAAKPKAWRRRPSLRSSTSARCWSMGALAIAHPLWLKRQSSNTKQLILMALGLALRQDI